MENYFSYYKGYKLENKRQPNKYIIFAIILLISLTFVFGLFGIIFSLAKGNSIKEVFQISPIVFIMTILSFFLIFPFLYYFISLIQKNKENWSLISLYLDEEDEIKLYARLYDKTFYIKGNELLSLSLDEISRYERNTYIRIEFMKENKEYFILFNEKDFDKLNLDSWLGSDKE